MIILDENIPEDQCQLLRRWRIRFRQVGQDIGRQGMKDQQHILPLLHELDRPTFFTRDLGFADKIWCHEKYALVCLAVTPSEAAHFIRRLLRHPSFNTKKKRMGTVIRASTADLRVWHSHGKNELKVTWLE